MRDGADTGTVAPLPSVLSGGEVAGGPAGESAGDVPTTTSVAPAAEVVEAVCETVVYTPSGADEPMAGEWCVPDSYGGDVVVLIHGGGGYEGSVEDVAPWPDIHRAVGRATLVIDHTLLDVGSGAAVYPRPEQNVMAAVQYVRLLDRVGEVDVDRVILHGFSAGARLAAIVATVADDPVFDGPELHADVERTVEAVILNYGYYDGEQFHGAEYYGPALVDGAPPPAADSIAMAHADAAPMLIVHGDDDVMTDPHGAVALHEAMLAAGGSARLIWIAGENHVFDGYGTGELTLTGAGLAATIDGWLLDLA